MNNINQLCVVHNLFITNFPGFISIRDENHKLLYLNDHFKNWIKQYTNIDVIGMTNEEISQHVEPDVGNVFLECHDLTMNYIYNHSTNNKIIEFVENNISIYLDILKFQCEHKGSIYIFTLGKDITKLYLENKHYKTQAYTDELTGLHNRSVLNKLEFDEKYTFVYIDLDNFKDINDEHGHLVGDHILLNFGALLRDSFRQDKDYTIRLGGDEFLIIIKNKDNIINVEKKITIILNKFKKNFNHHPNLSFSYGSAQFSENVENTLEIIDKLMYKNKKTRKQFLILNKALLIK